MLNLIRKVDWQVRLNEYLAEVQTNSFKYGKFDCCIFCAGAVEAITGVDPMSEFRGTYKNKQQSKVTLSKNGAGTLYKTLISKFGKPVHGASGKRGDIAYYEGRLGIIIGMPGALFLTDNGFHIQPLNTITKVFRIAP